MENQKELNALKLTTTLLLFFCSLTTGSAQQNCYIILSQDTLIKYEIHDYTLTTGVLYKSDYTIKAFNIIFSETENNNEQIVYFSVLPDLTTGDLWSQIDSIEVFAKQQNIDDLHYLFIPDIGYQENMQRVKRKYFNEYFVVIKEDGKYYKVNNSLMELYDIKSVDPIFPSPYGQLNLLDNFLTIQKYSALYKKYFPHYNLPFSNSSTGDNYNFRDGWRFWREYLSNIVDVYGHKGYKFWTAAASNITNGLDISRGVDRFIYIPKKGIVAGSYDFFFKQNYSASDITSNSSSPNNLTETEWLSNILEEKVMIAKELK